jgi:hypothetical protein
MRYLIWLLLTISTTSFAQQLDRIVTESTSSSQVNSATTSINQNDTTVRSPPPSAISPTITVINNDLCTVGVAGAVQTQVLGISAGSTVRDINCERIKIAKNLFDMGMKVAAVSTLCQDRRVFDAMMNAGTPCPVDGKIGLEAKQIWDQEPNRQPQLEANQNDKTFIEKYGGWTSILLFILLLI